MRFFTDTFKFKFRDIENTGNEYPVDHFTGTVSEFLQFAPTMPKWSKYARTETDTWTGFTKELPQTALEHRYSIDAHDAMRAQTANIETHLKAPAKLSPSPVGASFNIPRVLQGHPVSCYRRPRTALPPKTIEFAFSARANIQAKAITNSISRIARAANEYKIAGGSASIVVHYIRGYTKPNPVTKARACVISLRVPSDNVGTLALGASLQMARGYTLPFAKCLSGQSDDGIPTTLSTDPRIPTINGEPANDAATLRMLGVR